MTISRRPRCSPTAQEAAEINKALGIKALKGSADATTLDTARAAYIQLLGSLGSNAEVRAEVTRFRERLDQKQLQMLGPKPRKRPSKSKTAHRSSAST